MRVLYGFSGALLGAVLGGMSALLIASVATDGDVFGAFLGLMYAGPVSLVVGAVLGVMLALRVLRFVRTNGLARRKNALLVSGLLLAFPVLVAAMAWGIDRSGQPPSDQQLLSNFTDHRAAFDTLAQMKLADKGLMQVHDDWTQPGDFRSVGVSPERIAEYRHLLNEAGTRRGLQADGLHGADFLFWEQGSVFSSDTAKGYAYLSVPPKHILGSLDQYNDQSEDLAEIQAYRHIEGCWYLYYEYLPDED